MDWGVSEPHAVVSARAAAAATREALRQEVFILGNSPLITQMLRRTTAPRMALGTGESAGSVQAARKIL
ncbi:hypothetical protein GCM10010094_74120 [Streptomyces flaveus]|uniref:Uncharacterized protein n=1 Tax=Streptomyces flaveus TaxID=66370 RepID=A0A917RDM3_9ACTN|nr:hypothetical protein GCM10010094_74120 [Streptomyces flaveus]